MLGETTDQAIQAKIEKEAEENGDIVQVNYMYMYCFNWTYELVIIMILRYT